MSKDIEKEYSWVWAMLDAYLAKNKLKQTKQRKIILEVFMEAESAHMDAETVHGVLSRTSKNIGLATVYRSLNLLKDAGILEQHTFADGRAVFELSHPESHHDHLVCVDCGTIEEFENDEIERLQHEVAQKLGFELTSHRLELFGKCTKKNCPNTK
jgi:Fur family ferric uptake transcriptional regulator